MVELARQEVLRGKTVKLRLPFEEFREVFVTINYQDDQPFEVFIRYDDPKTFEWITALATLITRSLRAGQSIQDVGKELCEIYSPATRHIIPGTRDIAPSLVARIGRILMDG